MHSLSTINKRTLRKKIYVYRSFKSINESGERSIRSIFFFLCNSSLTVLVFDGLIKKLNVRLYYITCLLFLQYSSA